jgi:hypothetical protein
VTRDELVQAAIEALGRTHMVSDYLGDHDMATEEIVSHVVDTVLAKLNG